MISLFDHQKRFVDLSKTHPRYCFFAEPGVGKTIAILAAVSEAKAAGYVGKTLVLAPKSILNAAWCNDGAHFPTLKVESVWHWSKAKRAKMIRNSDADVLVLNYESFKVHIDELLAAGVTRLVVDESSRAKNHKSQISKACFEFSQRMTSVYMLSGTPAPNSGIEYFGQIRCVDPYVFGLNFYKFAFNYFAPQKRTINGREVITGWKPISARREEFTNRLARCSWSLRKVDCLDLPEQVDVIREVELSIAETNTYIDIFNQLRADLQDGRSIDVKSNAKLMKLRQVTGGMLLTESGPEILGRAKLDEMLDVIEEIGPQPVVVWALFTAEIDRIKAELSKLDGGVAVIDGRADANVRTAAIEAFQGGRLRYLVCQPQAAGHGITLTAAAYAIYYSNSFSWETYQQSRDRIHRAGQTRSCTYYHLVAPGTVDEKILECVRSKGAVHDAVMKLLAENPMAVVNEMAEAF